jgi:hypothetical protein
MKLTEYQVVDMAGRILLRTSRLYVAKESLETSEPCEIDEVKHEIDVDSYGTAFIDGELCTRPYPAWSAEALEHLQDARLDALIAGAGG